MNILISGASSGIGYELAKEFSIRGHSILALSRNKEKLLTLKSHSGKIQVLSIDLSKDSGKEELLFHLEKMNSIDIIINNAGQLINKPFLQTSILEFEQQFGANFYSAIRLIQWSHPYIVKSKKAHIVNISSMGGFQSSSKFHGLSAYSSSKGALSILTECLATEFKEYNIHVNALALGAVGTKMLENAFPGYEAPVNPTEMAKYIVDFSINGVKYFNGKILPVALGNP